MFFDMRMRLYTEIYGMRVSFMAALFIVLSFFFSGLSAARSDIAFDAASFMFGSKLTLISVFFSLLLKRAAALVMGCVSGSFVFMFPLSAVFILLYVISFSFAWGAMINAPQRFIAVVFLVLPAFIILFVSARTLSHMFISYAEMIRNKRFPKTAYEAFSFSKGAFSALVSSLSFTVISCAIEAVVACIAGLPS